MNIWLFVIQFMCWIRINGIWTLISKLSIDFKFKVYKTPYFVFLTINCRGGHRLRESAHEYVRVLDIGLREKMFIGDS